MKRHTWELLVGSLLLIMLLAACGGATSSTQQDTPGTVGHSQGKMAMVTPTAASTMADDPMSNSLKNLSGKEFDVKFMQEMIVHHQAAVDMAKLVPTHTKRPELNTLAANIIAAQTKEINQMTTWLDQWYKEKPVTDTMSVPGMMDMMGNMDTLKKAKDADFDKQFNTMMIQHHQQGVNMANLIASRTQRPALTQLGQNIIKTQSAEIQEMKNWQREWFKA